MKVLSSSARLLHKFHLLDPEINEKLAQLVQPAKNMSSWSSLMAQRLKDLVLSLHQLRVAAVVLVCSLAHELPNVSDEMKATFNPLLFQ